MNNSVTKHMPIFLNNIEKIITSVPVMEVHGQFVFICKLKVVRENLKLLFF